MAFDMVEVATKVCDNIVHDEIEGLLMLPQGSIRAALDNGGLTEALSKRIVSCYFHKLDADGEPYRKTHRYTVDEYLNGVEFYEYWERLLDFSRRAVAQVVADELKPIIAQVLKKNMDEMREEQWKME